MPTPFMSRATSQRSPTLTTTLNSTTNLNMDLKFPVDWGANVVNFISICGHPGLVRRTPFAAAHVPNAIATEFERRHRRNLSAITTIGLGRYPDASSDGAKPAYPILLDICSHNNNLNSFHKLPVARPPIFGHSRNISDPTACWGTYRVDAKHLRTNYPPDYAVNPFLPLSLHRSAASPERADRFSTSSDFKSQASPHSPSWKNCFIEEETKGVGDIGKLNVEVKTTLQTDGECLFTSLQPCVTPVTILIGLFFIMFVQTMVVSGLISSMLTTLERRFNFTTRQIGYLISCYESSGVLTTVVVSFVNGRKHNRLRIVGLATLLLSFGFALFAVPHFIVGPYRPETLSSPQNLLDTASCGNSSLHNSSLHCPSNIAGIPSKMEYSPQVLLNERDPAHSLALLIFCTAMILAGVGASPLHVLAPTYLWDNLDDKQYPIYSALFYSAGGLGPACGFLAGAGFLSLYIDAPGIIPRSDLNRNNPLWLGAWWLGFLVCSAVTFVAALPVIAFPKRLVKKSQKSQPTVSASNYLDLNTAVSGSVRASRHHSDQSAPSVLVYDPVTKLPRVSGHRATSESALPSSRNNGAFRDTSSPYILVRRAISLGHCSPQQRQRPKSPDTIESLRFQFLERLKMFLLVLRRVLTNPVWLGITFTSIVEQSIVAAFLAYAAKYIQDLFQIPAYLASIHTGAVVVPSSLLGVLTGALLMRRYRPPIDRTLAGISMMIGTTVVTTISLMLIGCPGNRIAGLTATYDGKPWPRMYGPARLMGPNLTAPCNAFCFPSEDTGSPTNHLPSGGSYRCSPTYFNPVCWRRSPIPENSSIGAHTTIDYMTFFSPCFAGCQVRKHSYAPTSGPFESFFHCRCTTKFTLNPSGSHLSIHSQAETFGNVVPGRCPADCPQYAVFLGILFLHILCTGILQNPSNVLTLSCVAAEDSSVALGLQLFFMRTLAYIPAPIYFGQLFDLVCQYRIAHGENGESSSSDGCFEPISPNPFPSLLTTSDHVSTTPSHTGACLQYNLEGLPLIWLGVVLALKLVSLAGATMTWRVAKLQNSKLIQPNSNRPTCATDNEAVPTEPRSSMSEHGGTVNDSGLAKARSTVQSDSVV